VADVRRGAVFFDLDGCLVDSRAAIAHCINHGLVTAGVEARPEAELYRFIGPPLLATFVELLGDAGADPAAALGCLAAYREVYAEVSLERTTVVPGISGAIAHLAARRPLAVVTSKPAEFARPILHVLELDGWFGEVFAPSLDALDEPKRGSLRRALEWSGAGSAAEAQRCWMVGDRHHDVDAGRACGVPTVGVTWGTGDRAELETAGADVVVDAPDELTSVLLRS
jgi:phosphoglycolate phosphatase